MPTQAPPPAIAAANANAAPSPLPVQQEVGKSGARPVGSGVMDFVGHLAGIPVIANELALNVVVWYAVEPHPIQKRRRQWRVVRRERHEPCSYKLANGTLVMHPMLIALLRERAEPRRPIAACLGICCPRRGRCIHYAEVELPGQPRVVRTCVTPEGTFPLFLAREPRRWTDESPVDGDGSSCD